ncbi:hypothetical protein T8S45_14155 [Blastomonas marina]|uniref:hypothetical protein n=1 Tax=Blastomonas marina TaxID=1867408 RepID=UPI002AC8A54A|nr:hypothetical protein [Blastomonas marina]WPZ03948.1 hypothetical protein T8S45_14155 [Blastomonas marina]
MNNLLGKDTRQVWARVLKEVERARDEQRPGEWITYLIRDPRGVDKRGNSGVPIYVGQTKEYPKRVLKRFRTCEKVALKKKSDCVEKRVRDLLHAGIVPTYEVLDRQATRLGSILSETNFARAAFVKGYDLANNQWPQNEAGPPLKASDLPQAWLWAFLVNEAEDDGLAIGMDCQACSLSLEIEIGEYAKRAPRVVRLSEIRNAYSDLPCPQCERTKAMKLRVVVPKKSRA